MDKMVKPKIAILNLAGELTPEFTNYFVKKNILIVNPDTDKSNHTWTHILTKDTHDFSNLSNIYETIEKDVKIISLTPVQDLQNFIVSNGKLIIDELWMRNSLGGFILDKFLQESGGISLEDNYPTFKEKGSFIITNPFNTGEYLDQMVQNAFTDGISGLSIKTFFDHLVMYLTGLKTKGKLGMPIEVMYGFFEDVFGVQLHFFTKDLILEDVSSSLSSVISKKAEKYLLNVAVQSTDFFDFTLLRDVNKTVITGLWTKDDRIQAENRGLLFNDLTASAGITSYPTEGVTTFQASARPLADFSDKVVLPPSAVEEPFQTTVRGTKEEKDNFKTTLGESKEEKDNFKTTLSESKDEEDNFDSTISGSKDEEDNFNSALSESKDEEDNFISTLGESKDLEDNFNTTISGSIDEEEVIQNIKGLAKEEEKVFKISGSKNFDVEKYAFRLSAGVDDNNKGEKNYKIKSLQNALPEAIKSSINAFASKLNKSLDDLTDAEFKNFHENEIPLVIKKTSEAVDAESFNKVMKKAFEGKINTLKSDNESLKSKMKTLASEVKILKESKAQMMEIQMKAAKAAAETSMQQSFEGHAENALKNQLMDKMNQQKGLNGEDAKKLAAVMERESKLLKDSKEHEIQLKKLQIEMLNKETFFSQEIEKMNRSLRAKDISVTKTKQGFTKLIERKTQEIGNLNDKLVQTNKLLASNQSQSQAQHIRDLEWQVQNHEKMIEIYKAKMIQKPVAKTDDEAAREENKRLQLLNNQVKLQLEASKKESSKLQERVASDTATIITLKTDKSKLELALKKAAQDAKKEALVSSNNHQQEQETKKLQLQNEFLDSQLKQKIANQKELELKLQEAIKNQKKEVINEEASTKGKSAHLENNVRKLTQDLVESRNQLAEMKKETNKLRQDKTSLQNQFDKMKKDLEKAKGAVPQKPGTPGKAA